MPLTAAKWQKIYESFVDAIRAGTLRSTDRIASTRELASLHGCHRFTVMTAMQALAAEGWLEVAEKRRYRVSDKIPVTFSQQVKRPELRKKTFTGRIVRPGLALDLEQTPAKLAFWGGQPDLRLFPKDEFRKILSATLRKTKSEQFGYGFIDGLAELQTNIGSYLRRIRSLAGREIVITNGSQEAIYLASLIYLRPGDTVAIEGRGYPPAWRLFESLGAKLLPLPVDDEGLVTEALVKSMRKRPIRLIYTTPLHQYPTTVTMSPRRRQELIQIAEDAGIPILEDDYDHEFHYSSPPPSPLAASTANAVYVCSFSKLLFPGCRLGVIACDAVLKEHLVRQKYLVSRQTDCLSQLALSAWIKDGGFERHVRKMRRIYEGRLAFMTQELETLRARHDIDWRLPGGGMSIWLDLKRSSSLVAQKAIDRGVFFQHEGALSYGKKDGTHLRLGFAWVNAEEIQAGMRVLGKCL